MSSRLNFVVIDRRTAWNIFSSIPEEGIAIVDIEEGYEYRNDTKIDYRKVIFEMEGKTYLLTGAAWPVLGSTERGFAFYEYAEERWSQDQIEPVSCPEMVTK